MHACDSLDRRLPTFVKDLSGDAQNAFRMMLQKDAERRGTVA